MIQYFFHVHDGPRVIIDYEGAEFECYEAAEREAQASVRDLAVDYIRSGRKLDGQKLEIMDKEGHSISFVPVSIVFD